MNVGGIILAGLSLIGANDSSVHDVRWGAQNSADAKVYYNVIDTSGLPVVDADVYVGYYTDYPKLKTRREVLKTDGEGRFVVAGNLNHRIGVSVDKDGWYRSFDCVELRKTKSEPAIVDGKWQPYGEKRKIVLYKYENPIEMPGFYDRKDVEIPIYGEWIPYDLEKGSWLPPYGTGLHPDVILRFSYEAKNKYWDYTSTMDVTFTNNPYAGFYVLKKNNASELASEYRANENAINTTSFHFTFDGNALDRTGCNNLMNDEYIVFRTRTKVNDKGELVESHYGKIMGGWFFSRGMTFYHGHSFNPNPNDTNLEDMETCVRSQQRRKHERERRKR